MVAVMVIDVTLQVHRATATDQLADQLARLLATPLADPFAEEVVAVPAKGVERWLAQRLSHRLGAGPGRGDGVCAGVRFLNPHSLVALTLGLEDDDPWHPDRLAWAVLQAVDECLDEPWAATLAQHLGHRVEGVEGELRAARRYSVARRLAGLFSSYAAQRPALVGDWRRGGQGDGLGGEVAPDLRWQPPLWRHVLGLVDAEPPDVRLASVMARLRDGDDDLFLPGRLSIFGHTRLAATELELLQALGEHRDVHLWLPQASPAGWAVLAPEVASGPVLRRDDRSVRAIAHPLLAALGRDSRELQRSLAPVAVVDATSETSAEGEVRHEIDRPPTLLELLQADVRANALPDAEQRAARVIAATDQSVQIHACHGAARQVDVLRDVITGLLEDDPTLEPRDILVMCPDIDAFAPLVHAGFGLGAPRAVTGEHSLPPGFADRAGAQQHPAPHHPAQGHPAQGHPAHGLRVRLADRGPRETNPLLELAAQLVVLAGGRLTASEVLDLARTEPVRVRFALDDDDLDRFGDWVDQVVIRWGLDEEHRADYQLSSFAQNTWRAGLDRVVVGAALDGVDRDHVGTVLALDDLDSGDIDLAGRLTELVDRLGATVRRLRACRGADEWAEALRDGVLGLADVRSSDAWQVTQLRRELSRIQGSAARETGTADLRLSDVATLLSAHLAGRATRANFRTGTLTVCTMTPMRSVPHRVVCLVGLDDGIFPRTTVPDGDDALARNPLTGERDPRSEDRQLLLDALMAARETVVITYTGADEHSGAERPPAVPLGEIIDAVQATASGPGAEAVVTRHPLQPYDTRNLGVPGDDGTSLRPDGRPFSYDPTALAGAQAALGERTLAQPLADVALPPSAQAAGADDVPLDQLIRFLLNPAQDFLRTRLGLLLPEVPEERAEGIPIELDGLQRWTVGDRLLRAVLAGRDLDELVRAEGWRGELPPGGLGSRQLADITEIVKHLTAAAWRVGGAGAPGRPAPTRTVDLEITLPDGRRVVGTVPGMTDAGALEVTYSTLKAKQTLRSWVTALALSAAGEEPSSAHLVGQLRRGNRPGVRHLTHGPMPRELAMTTLADLVDLRDRGLEGPIPLPVNAAHAYARTFLVSGSPRDAEESATKEWESQTGRFLKVGEQEDPAHLQVYGEAVGLHQILGEPRDDEMWFPGVTSRLGQYALRLWRPVLDGDLQQGEWA